MFPVINVGTFQNIPGYFPEWKCSLKEQNNNKNPLNKRTVMDKFVVLCGNGFVPQTSLMIMVMGTLLNVLD